MRISDWSSDVCSSDLAVSSLYLQALLSYEDRWFWHHPGVNPLSLLRATWQMLRSGHVVSGGSTLTMQVARILETDPEASTRTPWGKARQILRALRLEAHLSKREVRSGEHTYDLQSLKLI